MRRPRWALFISGQGSNMSAVLNQKWDLDVALVVSSRADAPGLLRARREGIPTFVLDVKIDWERLLLQLNEFHVSHIFLLGFMKVIPKSFLEQWKKPILNIHPSLLPQYPGLKSVERAYADQSPIGATVHHVVGQVDAGNIILQQMSISEDQTKTLELDECHWRNHLVEHKLVRESVRRQYV